MPRRLQPRKQRPQLAGGIPRIGDGAENAARREMMEWLKPFHAEAVAKLKSYWKRTGQVQDARPSKPGDPFQPSVRDIAELLAATRRGAESFFLTNAAKLAERWLGRVDKTSELAVRRAVQQLGISTKEVFKEGGKTSAVFAERVKDAVALIKTIPAQHFDEIEVMVQESIKNGSGVGDLVEGLQERYKVTESRAKFIAYDQTQKAFQELNRAEMKEIGIPKWQWIHSHGSAHPRPIHQALDGQVFEWENPPIIDDKGTRGFPGQLPRCGCTQRPVLV